MSLTPLKSVDAIDCTVPLGVGKASIDVTVQLERTSSQEPHSPLQEPRLSTQSIAASSQQEGSPEFAGQGSGRGVEKPQAQPVQHHLSAKRNLTQSFEEASLVTNSSGASESKELVCSSVLSVALLGPKGKPSPMFVCVWGNMCTYRGPGLLYGGLK